MYRSLDFQNAVRIINLPDGVGPQEPATVAQLNAAIEGLSWKDSVRVSTQGNVNLASPGATIDGVTMSSGDRFVARSQTTASQNGIYIWNGAATPATRAPDASTADELEQAVVTVEEGTNAGVSYRQTQVNLTLGADDVLFTTFGTSAGAATETSAGIAEIATQSETDTGTDDARFVTPLKLATSPWAKRKHSETFGDGSGTSFDITHNFNTKDVVISIRETAGDEREITSGVEVRRLSVNAVRVLTDVAVGSNAFRAVIIA
jgi:hypothetical protein